MDLEESESLLIENHDVPQSGQLKTQPSFEIAKYRIILYLLAGPNCTEKLVRNTQR